MNKIIEELVENNISVKIVYNQTKKRNEYIIDGFYKSGNINLIENGDNLIALSRYNRTTEIESLYDIVFLNYEWREYSRLRYDGWKVPDSAWLPLLLKFGIIKENIETIKTYEYGK